ncbi:hypothetical protein F5883DRAFT_269068 [Diaporthe sp. PMI_573]|nr:hypothetical protein F5883DRAFT_80641 [Diaporthaceae sp. PMI_573]KAH8744977.1 hypothetical protein F5883DRAFT_269068 [Diaporthaceae sp. PMI_573]
MPPSLRSTPTKRLPSLVEAEAMYKRALDGYEKALGLTQANRYLPALNTLQSLADLYIQLNRAHIARPLYTRCQAGLAVVFSPQHSRYQEISQKLATLD